MELNDFDKRELREIASFFGTELGDLDKKKPMLEVLTEDGVTAELALSKMDSLRETYAANLAEEQAAKNVVTTAEVFNEPTKKEQVVGAEEFRPKADKKYLIKMERENPYFEVGKYVFTKDHPYAIVDAEDVNVILRQEQGFRQALPDEIEEFYS